MSQFDLASIRHEVEKRQSQPKRTGHTPTTFSVRELSCGHFSFANRTQFTFVSEWSSHVPWIARFTKHNVLIKTPQRKAELRIPYASIVELIWSEKGKIALILSMPPIILVAEDPDLSDTFAKFNFKTRKGPDYTRVPYLGKGHAKVAGLCTAYCISVPADTVGGFGQGDFLHKISKLKADELIVATQFDFTHQVAGSPGCRLSRYPDALEALHKSLEHYTQKALLPFTFSFMLERLVRNGYLHPTVVAELGRKLVNVFQTSKRGRNQHLPISVDAFKKLFQRIQHPSPFADPRQFEADGIMQYLEQIEGELRAEMGPRAELSKDTQSSVNIFRAIITPTRITFEGPELEAKNRILRKFPDHIDYFLRAQFCDENGEDMHYNPKVSLDPIYARFKQMLSDGISLAEFKDIKSPARRAARIGQAFSETPFTVPLDTNDIVVSRIRDVERNDRIFSDGVGTISYGALECVWDALPESTGNPTALQVRWAGAKGMLSLEGCLIGRQICFRKSMDKFPSKDGATLEICDSAYRAIPMVLNRQVIKILEDLGAPDEWFLKLQTREMEFLRGITSSVFNTASFLRAQSIGGAVRLERFLRKAEKLGADYREDPFLRSAIEAVVLRDLRLLKYKTRIPVEKVKPLEIGVPVTAEHMADFFVEFMKADRLGVIATRHMILADQMGEGTFHPDCLELAKLHSSAVDFSKSGRPVEFGELPKLESYARPDFLAPGPWVKILTNSELMMDDHIAQDEEDEDADAPRYKHYYSQKILGKLYDDAIFGLATQWSDHPTQPLTEIEVFVGFILNKKGFSGNRQRDRSIKLKDEYDRIATGITRKMQSPTTATLEDRLAMLELYMGRICASAGRSPYKDVSRIDLTRSEVAR
ncbi:hypothetical protein NEMBOFW57_004519 [Staphylotrichum longicolle]|uniref:RNA-dependent RNA polymerase n=1 Tax=Staphylotrichum longicolle TaxID=669026 RepID=A0AAD4F6Z5_9PEZI|nr:hypothetical protein NEMBOFW57_004519 [Staphylotrichum longicolle]